MKNRIIALLFCAALVLAAPPLRAATNTPVNCGCVQGLPSLIVSNCPALVPDLCSLATNCFSTNVIIGGPNYCLQNPPPGSPISAGTNVIMFTVTDNQTNQVTCPVLFIVVQQPNPTLSLICGSNQTVECGSSWQFTPPVIVSTCCDPTPTLNVVSTVTNGVCPQIITRTWQAADACSNSASCSQTITLVDTTPPVVLCSGANLVANPGFENFAYCPDSFSQLDAAVPWFIPTAGSPDYFNACDPLGPWVSVPTNFGGYQIPLNGQGYGGGYVHGPIGGNSPNLPYREYLEAPLIAPLITGQTYAVSFHVNLADFSGRAIAEIGAHFSVGPVINYGTSGVLNVVPQVVNPSTNLLTSTNSWMLVQGLFTAVGGENHITLGNFNPDPGTTSVPAGGPPQYTNYGYYYYEDVSVVALCSPLVTNKTVVCGQPLTFDPPSGFDLCSGTNVTVTVAGTVTNGICPRIITRTWVLTDLCGNTSTWSQTVTRLDNAPPAPICNGPNLVPNAQFENFMPCPTNFSMLDAAYPWNRASDATPDLFNTCSSTGLVSVPSNYFGIQTPFSGQGYAGAYLYNPTGETNPLACYREYIQVQLLSPLVAGQTYPVSFRVCAANHCGHAIAEIGAHFSVGSISNGIVGVLNAVPQVVNPSNNLLTSTNSWMLVSGNYTAVGGETHITIGNFLTDAATTATPILVNATNQANLLADVGYYYYDNVYVGSPCVISPLISVPCGTPWQFDTVTAYDACSGTNFITTIVTVTNSICPFNATRTWTFTDYCGNSTNLSQTVNITDTAPPIPICNGGNNLVPNPSFETYTNCPNNVSQLDFAPPWYQPTVGTPDWFHTCATFNIAGVPNNFKGSQAPFTGQAYAGIAAYSLTYDYREYLQVPLLAPLVAGQSYTVSFRASLADDSGWAIAELGARLSVGPLVNYAIQTPLPVVPQVENPSGNILTSSSSWALVVGTFVATGGENFLTIGNFRADNATTAAPAGGVETTLGYYYIDDVSITTTCGNNLDVFIPCGAPFPTMTAYDLCSGTNITTTISDVTNSVCPLSVNRTWTFTDLCGNSTNVTMLILVSDNQPPVINCACLLAAAQVPPFTNGCTGIIPNLAFLTNAGCVTDNCGPLNFSQSPAAGAVVGPGAHPITVTFSDCGGNSASCVVPFNVLAPLSAVFAPPTIYALTCSNSAVVNYSVNTYGAVANLVCTPPPGSNFPLGTNVVTCVMTTSCGVNITNNFLIIVRSARVTRWSCMSFVIGIPYNLTNRSGGSGSFARMVNVPILPDGGVGANFENFAASGQDGPRFDFGPAEKFTFSTELDFNAANGAGFDLAVPPAPGETNSTTLLRFTRSSAPHNGWNVIRPKPATEPVAALYRSIVIGTNGELFSSFTQNAASLDTNILANLAPMNGATSVVMTVTLDCRTRELMLDFPFCDWTPVNARKGWDGCIYGNGPRGGSKTNKTARLILTPLTNVVPPAITNLDLIATNLATVAFDNPSITAMRRKEVVGTVSILKAFDDGTGQGVDFTSLGAGGSVHVELGYAAGFNFRMEHFQTGDVPDQEQIYHIIGSPQTTNSIRFTQTTGGIECAADFTQWGASNVTVQLWNGTTLVSETNHVPATIAGSLVSLGGFPGIIGCPSVGVLSLSGTNPVVVLGGLSCSSGCTGTELRIIAELPTMAAPPAAFTAFDCVIGDGMDNRLSHLQTTPACAPAPITAIRTAVGVQLNWMGDGFRLQGAETLGGAWYDLGASPPVTLPANTNLRLFRLRCD